MTRKYPMFQEPQRKDPVLKKYIEDVLRERGQRAQTALKLIQQAEDVLRGAPYSNLDDDPIFARLYKAVRITEITVRSDVDWLSRDHNDTYLSNKAVDIIGQQIEQDMGITYD